MRYRLAAVGKLRRGFYSEGCDFYLRRLQAFGRADTIEVKEGRAQTPIRSARPKRTRY